MKNVRQTLRKSKPSTLFASMLCQRLVQVKNGCGLARFNQALQHLNNALESYTKTMHQNIALEQLPKTVLQNNALEQRKATMNETPANDTAEASRQDTFSGVKDVPENLAFDIDKLEAYMKEHVEGYEGPVTVKQFKGGQSNPTYQLLTPNRNYVLRRKPPGKLLPSAHAVDREYRVITALGKTDVPVPKTFCMCEDETVLGTIFFIMEMVDGRILWDPFLPDMTPQQRGEIYDAMNDALARLHNAPYKEIGLETFGKEGNYFERQISRWTKQYRASETETIEEMDKLIEWLPNNIPPGNETTLVHGDYRIDNMIFHPTEPKVIAILDWELCTLGHPMADFSYHTMGRSLPADMGGGMIGVDLEALGIPSEEEYVAAYCKRTGRESVPSGAFYLAYNLFRMAGISQGIAGRVRDGTAASANADENASAVRPFAEAAWEFAKKAGAQ